MTYFSKADEWAIVSDPAYYCYLDQTCLVAVTHWGQVTHICVSKLTIIGSDNGLTPGRHQAIIWTNAGILLIGPLGINFRETSIEIHTFSFKKIHLKLSSGKWWPFCLCLNVLTEVWYSYWSRLCTTPFHHNGGSFLANTIGCHHNVVQYIMIFCSVLQWLMQNINQNLYSQKTRRQAIIWTNAGILLIEPLGTNFSEILIEI